MPAWRGATSAVLALTVTVLVAACDGDDPVLSAGDITSTSLRSTTAVEVTTTTTTADGAASAPTASTAPAGAGDVLTPTSLGPLQVGMSEADAAATGAIGAIGPGCELSGTRAAPLASGNLRGSAEFADGALGVITVTGGASTEEGAAVGDPLAVVEATYASGATVDVDRSVEEMFGIWLLTVITDDGGLYQMVVDPATESVSSMAVPGVAFCE